jgi:Ala-tRNA(Pro) deacylase
MSAVTDHLEGRGVAFEALRHEQAYTSIDEARALGIEADEVLKTLVIDTAKGHVAVVVPASRRLAMHAVQRAVGDRHARLASEEELRNDFPGFELGAFPPLSSLLGIPVVVDPEVMRHETVVFASGTQTGSVRCRTEDLFRNEAVELAELTRPSKD